MWTYNLFEALRRLGVKDARQPDLIRDQVMQAMVVGDVSHLTSPVLAPMCWAGGFVTAVAGEFGGFQVQSRGIGGCFIRQFLCSHGSNAPIVWSIDAADPFAADALGTALSNYDMGPSPVQSACKLGSTTVNLGTTRPRIYTGVSTQTLLADGFYIPRGSYFSVQCQIVLQRFDMAALVQDVVAQPTQA